MRRGKEGERRVRGGRVRGGRREDTTMCIEPATMLRNCYIHTRCFTPEFTPSGSHPRVSHLRSHPLLHTCVRMTSGASEVSSGTSMAYRPTPWGSRMPAVT